MSENVIKKGDTFEVDCFYADAQGTPLPVPDVQSQVRDADGNLIATLIFERGLAPGKYTLKCLDTSSWPIECLFWDIVYSNAGVKTSSETMTINVIQGVTKWQP